MSKEEIENRITLCEIKANEYREVGNTKTANRYDNERYKWGKLLNSMKPIEEDYKRGYNNLKQALLDIKKFCEEEGVLRTKLDIKKFCEEEGVLRTDDLIDTALGLNNDKMVYVDDILDIVNKALGADSDE